AMELNKPMADPFGNLTTREQELLKVLVYGRTNAQIADELNIKLNTIKYHLKNLYSKLNVKNRTQAVAIFLRSQEAP
ncbi:MAG: LuxR C-terminal-related transcriptional regulator, partial [Rhodospirillales bacterium]